MGIKFDTTSDKMKKIPDEFKDLAKDFADKGLSPYRHIEFFEVANTLSSSDVPPSTQTFKFSKVEAELEGKLLHLRYRGKDSEQNKYYILTQQ